MPKTPTKAAWWRDYYKDHPRKDSEEAKVKGGKKKVYCKECLAHHVAAKRSGGDTRTIEELEEHRTWQYLCDQ